MTEEAQVLARAYTGPQCGYCRDCKWWQQREWERSPICQRLEEDDPGKAMCWVWVSDGVIKTGHAAFFYPESDFGCVQWQPKPAVTKNVGSEADA